MTMHLSWRGLVRRRVAWLAPLWLATGCSDSTSDRPDGGDSGVCYGTAGLVRICLAQAPLAERSFATAATIDTDVAESCSVTLSGATSYCVIAATNITIDARLRATGTRPLVLLATGAMTSSGAGQIDVGSHLVREDGDPETGAGADPTVCGAGVIGIGGAGGAGGSFFGEGGRGNLGSEGGTLSIAAPVVTAITEVRGGCAGQFSSGHGGGAVYLLAGMQITLAGGINAGGEGGHSSPHYGGGGGGAGGMIGLEAPMIAVTSLLVANGGGGGGGGFGTIEGEDGADAITVDAASGGAPSGAPGHSGNGSAGAAAGPGELGSLGCGGGGGAGLIKAPATASLGTQVSPTATP